MFELRKPPCRPVRLIIPSWTQRIRFALSLQVGEEAKICRRTALQAASQATSLWSCQSLKGWTPCSSLALPPLEFKSIMKQTSISICWTILTAMVENVQQIVASNVANMHEAHWHRHISYILPGLPQVSKSSNFHNKRLATILPSTREYPNALTTNGLITLQTFFFQSQFGTPIFSSIIITSSHAEGQCVCKFITTLTLLRTCLCRMWQQTPQSSTIRVLACDEGDNGRVPPWQDTVYQHSHTCKKNDIITRTGHKAPVEVLCGHKEKEQLAKQFREHGIAAPSTKESMTYIRDLRNWNTSNTKI